jgi:ribosomal protein L12E/L44/L45/RPP1/RPP2
MPLKRSPSDKARSENIREMIDAGHDPAQAVAAAYSQQRRSQNHQNAATNTRAQRRVARRIGR